MDAVCNRRVISLMQDDLSIDKKQKIVISKKSIHKKWLSVTMSSAFILSFSFSPSSNTEFIKSDILSHCPLYGKK